jgi:hypothetical protein
MRTGQASREAHVKPKQLLGYAVIAFIGNFLSSVARGFSEFLSSL